LKWRATIPERWLQITIAKRNVILMFMHILSTEGDSPVYELEPGDLATIDEAIEALVDQERFQCGDFPTLPGPLYDPERLRW
jgi:hypothetical protein